MNPLDRENLLAHHQPLPNFHHLVDWLSHESSYKRTDKDLQGYIIAALAAGYTSAHVMSLFLVCNTDARLALECVNLDLAERRRHAADR